MDLSNGLTPEYLAQYNTARQTNPNLDPNPYNVFGQPSIATSGPYAGQMVSYNSAGDILGHQAVTDNSTPPPPASGSGATVSPYQDKSNDIALQNAGLSSVDTQQNSGLAAVDKALGGITGQYDTEAGANEKSYSTNSDTNQSNLQRNKESALLNASQGRRGLFGTLSSLGALNGSGVDLANRAVAEGANKDLSGAGDTFAGNQSALDTSIGTFRTEDKQRRDQAATAAADAKTGVQNQGAKDRMAFLKNLSDDYAAEGNTDQAKSYADQAGALYPQTAATSVPSSNLGYTGAAFTAPTLANYLTSANNTQVSTTPGAPGAAGIPGLTADNRKKLQPA